MKEFKRYVRLYFVFVKQFTKSIMQSKVDFFIGLFGFILSQATGIAFLYLVFQQIPKLNDWTFEQLLFIYGFAQIPRGIDHLFADNLWILAWKLVITGNFDKYMLRPMNLFFQVICDRLQPDALGELIVGSILVGISASKGVIVWNATNIILFIVSIFLGAIIYTSIKLFFASTAFWFKDSSPFLQTAYNLSDLAKYPLSIYPKAIQVVISYILPFAFVAYIPAKYFLVGGSVFETIFLEGIIALVLWVISYGLFKKGTSVYESSGN